MAMAVAAKRLGVPLSLFVPLTTMQIILDKLRVRVRQSLLSYETLLQTFPIDLNVVGSNWDAANAAAEAFIESQPKDSTFFVHPFGQVRAL